MGISTPNDECFALAGSASDHVVEPPNKVRARARNRADLYAAVASAHEMQLRGFEEAARRTLMKDTSKHRHSFFDHNRDDGQPPPATRGPVESQIPPRSADDDVRVQVVTEDLDVGKRRVETGGVHLETTVVAEPVVRDLALCDERITVERTHVDRVISAADADRLFHDVELEIAAHRDEPVVEKHARVVEEVVIKRLSTTQDRVVHDHVRRMDVDVDDLAKRGAR
ncbi:MAG TPA: YsnF/AvaK domain-containing protein [Kofleriaceae bacterium]